MFIFSCSHNRRSQHIPTGLALGGGGAKAAAEIGVLEEIEYQGIKIDYIAGSSMGAVIGGLYAAGYSSQELREMWLNEDWLRIFDENTLFKLEDNNRTIFGLINAGEFERQLRKALSSKGCRRFKDTRIPFACTVTQIIDETTVEGRVLCDKDMDMASAICASMTYPAPLVGHRPMEIEGMRLVDGGMTNNLPVDVVDSMGAKRVIAVDLEMRDHNDEHPFPWFNSLLRLYDDRIGLVEDITDTGWLMEWKFTRPDSKKRNANLKYPNLIYIHPILDEFNIMSFSNKDAKRMMFLGRDAAEKEKRKLKKSFRRKR